jgi:selenocysteine lyase/cysteine desulfurase
MTDALEARALFPITDHYIFMNHAGVSPMSERVRAAVIAMTESLSRRPVNQDFSLEHVDQLRASVGRLVGAPPDTIGFTRGTAHGISLLAQGLDWREGDNVVGARGEYPANVYPWMSLQDRGVEYRLAEPVDGRVTPQSVLDLVDGRTRVVALSHVEFWNGFRVDLEKIGAECRSRGVIFAVDAIQSAGALRIDLASLPVDYLCAGAYKWLMGPTGFGFLYCRAELVERLKPVLLGPGSMKRNLEYFNYDLDFAPTSRRFEESGKSLLDVAALQAAVGLFLEVGVAVVEKRVLDLSQMLACGIAEHGYELVEPWPRTREESSGIVSFRRPGASCQEVLRDLNAAHVVGRTHADFVRLCPHFYNSEDEVRQVLDVLAPQSV